MIVLEGAISVKAALECGKRVVEKVMILDGKHSKDLNYILYLCHTKQILIEFVSEATLQSYASKQTGGVIAVVSTRKFEEINEVTGLGLLCEGIEDPYNLGMMMRTAYCAGYETILLPSKDYQSFESILCKSSAGAFERMNVILLDDIEKDCNYLLQKGYQLVSAMRGEKSKNYRLLEFPSKFILCIGGEKRGLSKSVLEKSAIWVEIKYPKPVKVALSAVSSCSILCFTSVEGREFSDENYDCSR